MAEEKAGGGAMLRIMKIALVLSVALWGIVGARGNIIDWNGTIGAVAAVTSMATFAGGASRWEATTNPAVLLAGAAFIVLFKVTCAALCGRRMADVGAPEE
jgi:predicted small integral membrane protein